MTFSKIIGVGGYLPDRIITNAELAISLKVDTTWIGARTGIQQRHIAHESEFTSDLALKASESALKLAGITSDQLDLIIIATATPDLVFPSTACILQRKLKAGNCQAFDVHAVCAGFTYALHLANSLIKTDGLKYALVVGADTFSRFLDWNDKVTCVLFGDGAGAVVLSRSEQPGILASSIQSNTDHQSALGISAQIQGGKIWGDPYIRMDGRTVLKCAVSTMTSLCQKMLTHCALTPDSVDWLVLHQANMRIIEPVGEQVGFRKERVINTVAQHGNTSAASIPLALNQAVSDGRIQTGHKVLIAGVGAGFTSGSALFIM